MDQLKNVFELDNRSEDGKRDDMRYRQTDREIIVQSMFEICIAPSPQRIMVASFVFRALVELVQRPAKTRLERDSSGTNRTWILLPSIVSYSRELI
jgi:hypothetical protein